MAFYHVLEGYSVFLGMCFSAISFTCFVTFMCKDKGFCFILRCGVLNVFK